MICTRLLTCLLLFQLSICSYADKVQLISFGLNDVRYQYCTSVLKLIIEKSQHKFGAAKLVLHSNPQFVNAPAARNIELLATGKLDVGCLGYNLVRKNRFNWVEPGINMGTLGYRILLMKAGNQFKFDKIHSLLDLSDNIRGGFVSSWSDTHILDFNGINTLKTSNYSSLINMLKVGRFDYVSRGINEIWGEINASDLDSSRNISLVAEQNLAFYYPADHYLVTGKANEELAKRLVYGMEKALQDGSLKTLFFNHMGPALKKANIKQRRVFYLINPEPMLEIKTDWWLESNLKINE